MCEDMKTIMIRTIIGLALCLFVSAGVGAAEQWIKVAGGKWDPTPKMLSDLKMKIKAYVASQAKADKRELQNWQTYTIQYQGQEEKGNKYIFINAFCDQDMRKRDLSKEIIQVFDGGTCYFSLKYNPEKKTFFDLLINGDG
jgi:hypothetical protein